MNQDLNNNYNNNLQSNYEPGVNPTIQNQNSTSNNDINNQPVISNDSNKGENPIISKKALIIIFLVILMLIGVFIGIKFIGKDNIPNNPNTEKNLIPEGVDFKSIDKSKISYTDEKLFKCNNIDDDTCEITYNESEDKIIKVPETIAGKKVVGIKKWAFINNKVTEYIILPDTVEYIDDNSFVNDEALRYVDFGKNLKKIGYGTFNNVNLETVDFPDGMESMNFPFGFAENLKEVYIPASVTEITEHIAITAMTPNIVIVTPVGSKAEEIAKRDGLPVKNS